MKNHALTGAIILLALFFSTITEVYAQDIIIKRIGEEIKAKVTEISPTEIRYKRFDNLTGPTIVIPKEDVATIQYENGTHETFPLSQKQQVKETQDSVAPPPVTPKEQLGMQNKIPSTNMFLRGKTEAKIYYKGYKGAAGGTFLVAFFADPVLGLIPAIACSSHPPKPDRFTIPDQALRDNADYMRGYSEQARSMKRKRVWKNWLIGAGINVVLATATAIIISESQQYSY